MKENYLNKNAIHSTRNKKFNKQKIYSEKYFNTASHRLKNLNTLEEIADNLSKSKIIIKSYITKNNNKVNSYDNKYPFNTFLSKTFRKDLRKKLFYLKDNKIIEANSSNIISYINKRHIDKTFNKSFTNKNLSQKEKANFLESQKILKTQEKIDKKNEKFQKFLERKKILEKQKNENEEIKNERQNLKIKMYRILNKKGQICSNFIKKNDNFNLRFINYLNSKHYIKSNKIYSDNFHFSKNDLSQAHDPYKQYLTTYKISKNSTDINDIFNSLKNKDKKIIEKEPNYFFRNNKVLEEFKDLEKKPLITTIREEEEIQNMILNKVPKKEIEKYKGKKDIVNQRIIEYNNKINNDKIDKSEDVPLLVNPNTIKIIKKEFDIKLKARGKKKNYDINHNVLNNVELNIAQNNLNIFEDNKNFNNTYNNKNIKFDNKIKLIDNNNKRLYREELFHIKRKKRIIDTVEEGDKHLNNIKNKIMGIYNSIKNDIKDNDDNNKYN